MNGFNNAIDNMIEFAPAYLLAFLKMTNVLHRILFCGQMFLY